MAEPLPDLIEEIVLVISSRSNPSGTRAGAGAGVGFGVGFFTAEALTYLPLTNGILSSLRGVRWILHPKTFPIFRGVIA